MAGKKTSKAPNRTIAVKTYKRKFSAAKLPPRTPKGQWKPKSRQQKLF